MTDWLCFDYPQIQRKWSVKVDNKANTFSHYSYSTLCILLHYNQGISSLEMEPTVLIVPCSKSSTPFCLEKCVDIELEGCLLLNISYF